MQAVMIGAGYVGLTAGACLAELGHEITCVDIDSKRIDSLSRNTVPIYEPHLHGLVRKNARKARLRFSTRLKAAVGGVDAIFLAVGTPSRANGDIDLTHIENAARQIAPHMSANTVVVVKSTVVVGTCKRLREIIAEERGGLDFSVAANPEFMREGSAVEDFVNPDRIVIGADDPQAVEVLKSFYKPMANRDVPVIVTTTGNAELIKYAANAFLALKVGFINDVAHLCEKVGGDIAAIARGVGLDHRIGPHFLRPGPGFGGSCFPKDTRAFVATGRHYGAPQPLIETLVARNEERKAALGRRVLSEARANKATSVAILGLAFKANTDDVRESAALTIIPLLQAAGLTVRAHDPQATKNAARLLSDVVWQNCPYAACRSAGIVVILTDWDDYGRLDLARIGKAMAGDVIFDYRNLLVRSEVLKHGLRYIALGQPAASPSTMATPPAAIGPGVSTRGAAAPNHI